MSSGPTISAGDWRRELPRLTSERLVLREPGPHDVSALRAVLSSPGALSFGIGDPADDASIAAFIDQMRHAREAGAAFAYAVAAPTVVGLFRVRPLSPSFEAAEWDGTLREDVRGTGVFVEAAHLLITFAFDIAGVHRLEARIPAANGRALGAMRKLGAVQEGLLRKSLPLDGGYVDQTLWSILRDDRSSARSSGLPAAFSPVPPARIH
jgi:RimJ/RimL family protein N-acetyltransferase